MFVNGTKKGKQMKNEYSTCRRRGIPLQRVYYFSFSVSSKPKMVSANTVGKGDLLNRKHMMKEARHTKLCSI